MAITKLYRVIVRQRVNWTTGVDTDVPELIKPAEKEGASIERDVTSYVKDYKLSKNRETLSSDANLSFISPEGLLHPENYKSSFNLDPRDGITFAPLLAEGNEIQIYRVMTVADLSDSSKWISRFRGTIKSIQSTVEGGHDGLEVIAADILARTTKALVSGSFSPIVRSSSLVPPLAFYTTTTLTAALTKFRAINASYVTPTYWDTATRGITGAVTADTLARLIWWDRYDVLLNQGRHIWYHPRMNASYVGERGKAWAPKMNTYWKNLWEHNLRLTKIDWNLDFSTKALLTPHFIKWGKEMADYWGRHKSYAEVQQNPANYPTVNADNSVFIYGVCGHAWLAEPNSGGSVSQDLTRRMRDLNGSLKIQNGKIRFGLDAVPSIAPSLFRLMYRTEDSSSVRIRIRARLRDWTADTFDATQDAATPVLDVTLGGLAGGTLFSISELGGTTLNDPGAGTFEFKQCDLVVAPFTYPAQDYATQRLVYEVEISTAGTVWIDDPRWEYEIISRNEETGVAQWRGTNLLDFVRLERWSSTDGVTFFDPHPTHRTLLPKSVRVIKRNLRAPYPAGTTDGYGPQHLKNRSLPENYMYETELVEGQDFEVLPDKGAIRLSSEMHNIEILVAHGYYDTASSPHMEASEMLRHILVTAAGIPDARVILEKTGVILSRVEFGIKSALLASDAIREISKQLPANYHLFADGNGTVHGRFIQQEGSPRIFAPLIEAPLVPLNTTIMADGKEHWYALSNIMPDGKESLISNLMSTVEYQNYYDGAHESLVSTSTCPAIQCKMAPGAVGLVVRRATAYKSAADIGIPPTLTPKYNWDFNGATPFRDLVSSTDLTYKPGAFTVVEQKILNTDVVL